jgi:hypothetical protein
MEAGLLESVTAHTVNVWVGHSCPTLLTFPFLTFKPLTFQRLTFQLLNCPATGLIGFESPKIKVKGGGQECPTHTHIFFFL